MREAFVTPKPYNAHLSGIWSIHKHSIWFQVAETYFLFAIVADKIHDHRNTIAVGAASCRAFDATNFARLICFSIFKRKYFRLLVSRVRRWFNVKLKQNTIDCNLESASLIYAFMSCSCRCGRKVFWMRFVGLQRMENYVNEFIVKLKKWIPTGQEKTVTELVSWIKKVNSVSFWCIFVVQLYCPLPYDKSYQALYLGDSIYDSYINNEKIVHSSDFNAHSTQS